MSKSSIPTEVIQSAWAEACAFWGATIDIAVPIDLADTKNLNSIAFIEMNTRQVKYNSNWFRERGIYDCFPAVFAHELAHHMRYPHTLRVMAELMLMGNRIHPGLSAGLINLFLDLLVNEHVGRNADLRFQLIKLYTAIAAEPHDDLYRAYLCVYESLWFPEADFKLKLEAHERALIRGFTDSFYQLANIYEQFLYFLLFFERNYEIPVSFALGDPLTGDAAMPSVGDFPVDGSWSKDMWDAYEKAVKEGWGNLTSDALQDPTADSFSNLSRVMRSLAGQGQPDAPKKAALRYYRTLIERAIDELPVRLPAEKEPFQLLSSAEEWEYGDEPGAIDWLSSIERAGDFAGARPLKRELLIEPATELEEGELGVPDFEIYLDTSGSMPDPVASVNVMTLAALVLSTYAVRKGGRVYGVVYSSGQPIVSPDWMLEEPVVQAFFLNYFGGGTEFPFKLLKSRQEKHTGIFRVIISDRDFVSNLEAFKRNVGTVLEAADRSSVLVLFLLRVERALLKPHEELLKHPRIRFVPVADPSMFAGVAAELAHALMGEL